MNEKQQQLTFEKGITNVPSDAVCSDNALAEEVGMIYYDGEHHVIQNPVQKGSSAFGGTLLFTHNLPDATKNYICETGSSSPYTLVYYHQDANGNIGSQQAFPSATGDIHVGGIVIVGGLGNASEHSSPLKKQQITAIGKTLIVAMDDGLRYYIWKGTAYKYMGDRIPVHKVEPFLVRDRNASRETKVVTSTVRYEEELSGNLDNLKIHEQEAWNSIVVGLYNKNKKHVCQKKRFCLPFFVRTALELFDGSYIHVTNPVLLFPSVKSNSGFRIKDSKDVICGTICSSLYYRGDFDFTEWSDIVKGVTVFISAPIEIYDTLIDQSDPEEYQVGEIVTDWLNADSAQSPSKYRALFYEGDPTSTTVLSVQRKLLAYREESDIVSEIKSTSLFYKLCDIGLRCDNKTEPMDGQFDTHTLENIVNQQQLKYDDYFSFCQLYPEFLYAYNGRLNMANVRRGFFEGFTYFMPRDVDTPRQLTYTVTIGTDNGDVTVTTSDTNRQEMGNWFFYPDPRAKSVTISDSSLSTELTLTEHPGLHGAYFFDGLPSNPENDNGGLIPSVGQRDEESVNSGGRNLSQTPITTPRTSGGTPATEPLNSYLLQSEVNNPWVFRDEGYHMVGDGNILAMSTQTVALSQGQFGQYPLVVFTDEGIWGLSVASTGIYAAAHPFSREVLSNPDSVVQTDGAIFFVSKKGLMRIIGSQVACVSSQLSGKMDAALLDGGTHLVPDNVGDSYPYFFEHCKVAYDYRDSLLWMFASIGHEDYALVYSIKNGTFAHHYFVHDDYEHICVDYPDTLLQDSHNNVYSLMKRGDINDDSTPYATSFITRPMKLENALALKSIMQMRHIHDLSDDATLQVKVFASNNLRNWAVLNSLGGSPWKYYRLKYQFTNLKATDTFAGTMLVTQERRNLKLR